MPLCNDDLVVPLCRLSMARLHSKMIGLCQCLKVWSLLIWALLCQLAPINTGNVLQVQDSLNQVGLPDLGKAGDQASDAKDNVQNAANKLGLEWLTSWVPGCCRNSSSSCKVRLYKRRHFSCVVMVHMFALPGDTRYRCVCPTLKVVWMNDHFLHCINLHCINWKIDIVYAR